jgi:hypothetical protein
MKNIYQKLNCLSIAGNGGLLRLYMKTKYSPPQVVRKLLCFIQAFAQRMSILTRSTIRLWFYCISKFW